MKKIFTKFSLLFLGLFLCMGNVWADGTYHDPEGQGYIQEQPGYYEVTTANGVTYRIDYTFTGVSGTFAQRSIVRDNGAQYAYIVALPSQYVIQLDRTISFDQGTTGPMDVTVAIKPGTFTSFNGVILLPDWYSENSNKNVFYVRDNYTDTDQHPSFSDVFGNGVTIYAKTTKDNQRYSEQYRTLYLKNVGNRQYFFWNDHISALYSGPGELVAEDDFGTGLHWAVYDNDSLAITGSGAMPDYAYASTPATPWSEYMNDIRFVGIGSGVTKIGAHSFYKESNDYIKSVRFAAGSQLTEIGDKAFGYTKISSIALPSGLETIGNDAFTQCDNLVSVTLPASVSSLGYELFYASDNLETLTVLATTPPTIATGGYAMFSGTSINTIIIPDETVCDYKDAWGYDLGGTYVYKYSAAGEEVECAAQTSGTCGTNLNWSIDGGVLTISGTGTTMNNFSYNTRPWEDHIASITSVVIEAANMTNIGNFAFRSCTNLATVTLGASVTTIGTSAFDNCSAIAEPIYNSHVFVKMPNAWLGTHGGDYVIVDGTELIYSSAFEDCTNLTSITMPDDVTTIGSWAFYGCSNLASVTLGDNVTTIGNRAFQGCTALATPLISGTKFLQMFPSNYSGEYIIPDGIVEIVMAAFNGCTGITSVEFPNTVTTIGDRAFQGCTALASVTLGASIATIGTDAFKNCPLTSPLMTSTRFFQMYPVNHSGAYTIPNGITTISANAFMGCTGLTSVIIPNSATNIGTGVFQGCSNLTSVTLPSGITSIPANMFKSCGELAELHMKGKAPSSVGDDAFDIYYAAIYVPKGTYGAYVNFADLAFWAYDIYEENVYGDATAVNENYSWWDEYYEEHEQNYATDAYNALVASANAHEFAENFTIVRPIQANGYLNTICLPFDLSAAQIANSDLADAEIFAFDAQNTGAEIEMVLNEVTEMEAGMPYFFRYPNGTAETPNLGELNFHNVTVKTATATPKTVDAGTFRLKGTLQNTLLNSATNYLFLGAEDALFYPDFGGAGVTNDDLTLRPFRAYFEATGGANNAPARFVFGRKTPTDVESIPSSAISSQKIIENGKLFIIKNGVKYNVQGQIVK